MAENDTIDLIRKRLSSMPAVGKRIGSFILADPQKVTEMTLRTLAAEVGVAEGSIINFTTRLGFDGYTSLKLAIARSLAKGEALLYESVTPGDSAKDVMRKMRDNASDALRATCESVTDAELMQAVALITGAKKRIEVYGIGSSAMIADDAAFRFIKLGLPAVVVKDSYIGSVSALMMDSDCLAMAVSYTGRTHDLIKTMSIAKSKGAKTMCITCYADSPLAQMCDLALIAVSGEAVVNKLATVSRIAQMMLIDTLCEYIASRRTDAARQQSEIINAWGEYWVPENDKTEK
ncbi:MAG: MurR/RpiR family transcriptional regulator [Clostridia bacterium]|nr:MurR/RpiR family transcriptional regulator [Clostridia bacterium]MBQ2708840.1 MurR/RpiR family transcriptional regulator [Clostridia bacterium]